MDKFLLIIILYLPFQLALNPMAGVDLASIRVLILLLFFVWLAQGLKKKNLQIKNNWQTGLVVAFLFLNVISIIVAKNTDWSIRKLLFLFSIFPLYFVASQLISSREKALKIIKTAVFGGAVIAIIGILQFVSQFVFGLERTYSVWANFIITPFLGSSFSAAVLKNPSWLVNIAGQTYLRATSLFPDPHMFSFYLGLLAPLAFGLIVQAKNKKKAAILSFSLIIVADLLTFSRGGQVGLFVGLVFMGIFAWAGLHKNYKVITTIVFLSGLAILFVPSPISQRFLSSFDLNEGSNQGRLQMWQKASAVILDKPFLGTGIGNYPLEVVATATYRDPIYAHNTYLDIAVETGILNMSVWLGILILVAVGFWRKAKKERLFFFALVSLIIFATHSMVETAIYSPVVLSLFLIIISLNNMELQNEKTV